MRAVSSVLALAVSLSVAGVLLAQGGGMGSPGPAPAKEKGQEDEAKNPELTGPLGVYRGLDLTADQKSKMSDLMKKYKSKLRSFDHRNALEGLLTPEQKKARQQAVKEARDAGKDSRDISDAGDAALQLTDQQKTKLIKAEQQLRVVYMEVQHKVMADILTDAQKEQLRKYWEGRAARMKWPALTDKDLKNLTDAQKEQMKKLWAAQARMKTDEPGNGPAPAAAGNTKGQEDKAKNQEWDGPLFFLNRLDLTADQKVKIKRIEKEFKPRLDKLDRTLTIFEGILTPKQRKAYNQVAKEAKDAGEGPKRMMDEALAAVQLTNAQKAKHMEAIKRQNELYGELRHKVRDILTDAQKAQIGIIGK